MHLITQPDTLLESLNRRYYQPTTARSLSLALGLASWAAVSDSLYIPDKALALFAARAEVQSALNKVEDVVGVTTGMEPSFLVAHCCLGCKIFGAREWSDGRAGLDIAL